MHRCWITDAGERPSFAAIRLELQPLVNEEYYMDLQHSHYCASGNNLYTDRSAVAYQTILADATNERKMSDEVAIHPF